MRVLLIANGKDFSMENNNFDKIICVDGGLNAISPSIVPDLIIGDFDSVKINKMKKFKNKSKILYKDNQDISDLKFAVNYCLSHYKPDEIIIVNSLSLERFDHSMCNVFLLREIPERIEAKILTKTQEIFIVRNEKQFKNFTNKTVSIIPLSDCKNVKTNGFKWEIDYDLQFGFIDGISNVIVSKNAKISVKKGELLIVLEKK